MKFLSLLGSVVDSVVVTTLMIPIAVNIAIVTDIVANPPKNAFYQKCVATPGDAAQKVLCDWVNQTVEYYDKKCNNCMKREGSYPITISWSDQSKEGTLGHAIPGKFACKIELATNENWVYDGGMKFRTTVLHEIGHCYGLEHDLDPKSLMYPSHNPDFTEQDVLLFVERLERLAK